MSSHAESAFTRRQAIVAGAAVTAGGWLLGAIRPARGDERSSDSTATRPRAVLATEQSPQSPGMPGVDYNPVVVPNGAKLPWRLVDGVKVFHIVAEELWHEFITPGEGYDGLKARVWGYNGVCHGPAIEAVEGDRVRVYLTNRLSAATTIHWHGVLVPSGMDGVGGVSQRAVAPGETCLYEFTLRQHGTAMYHAHHDEMTQMGMGMTGLFIVHPRGVPKEEWPDRDFALMLHEWRIDPGTYRPNPNEMTDFNVLTMNARAFPGTEPLVVRKGDRVRIRFGNLGAMSHHPIHLHGYRFLITQTDGGEIPTAARWPETTVLVAVGTTRTIEFVADEPGDWPLHCHMTHHVMNQMSHQFPNMIGVDPGNLDATIRGQTPSDDGAKHPLLPAYMTMGQSGMAEMGEMGMKFPANTAPMIGGRGKHDYITMGGMFTILKVRDGLATYADPGWYESPPGTLAGTAVDDALRRDGVDVTADPGVEPAGTDSPTGLRAFDQNGRPAPYANVAPRIAPVEDEGVTSTPPAHEAASTRTATRWTCTMHPDVIADAPGSCPKCGMKLVVKKS